MLLRFSANRSKLCVDAALLSVAKTMGIEWPFEADDEVLLLDPPPANWKGKTQILRKASGEDLARIWLPVLTVDVHRASQARDP